MSQPEVPDGAPFELESVKVGSDAVVVRMKGDADLHNAPALRDALERAIGEGAMTVVVDLTGVTFVDSMMLGVLLGAVRRLRLKGGEMRIAVDDPHVRRIFEMTLLDRVFSLCPSLHSALEHVE